MKCYAIWNAIFSLPCVVGPHHLETAISFLLTSGWHLPWLWLCINRSTFGFLLDCLWVPLSQLDFVGVAYHAWAPNSPFCLLALTFSIHKWGHCENLYRRVYGHIFLFTWVMYMYVYFSHIHTCIYIRVINKSRTSRSLVTMRINCFPLVANKCSGCFLSWPNLVLSSFKF